MSSYGVSIVTTTWKESENIQKLIPIIRDVLKEVPHEIIVVDDSSPDGTFQVAERLADRAVKKVREGQSKGLLYGMKLAKYQVIVTIDADLENDPKYIPKLVEKMDEFDLVVASRTELPRISEKIASKILGRTIGVKDVFSNFRVYKHNLVSMFELKGGETFGGEFLVIAKKKGAKIGEIGFKSVRRKNPRIGGNISANLRITWALLKSIIIYLI